MKICICFVALVCLVLAAPALAEEPSFLTDSPLSDNPELAESLDAPTAGSCDVRASVERFPEADREFLASCGVTTTCGPWSYSCGCGGEASRGKQSRTCEDKCCTASGQCFYSGPYSQSQCMPIYC